MSEANTTRAVERQTSPEEEKTVGERRLAQHVFNCYYRTYPLTDCFSGPETAVSRLAKDASSVRALVAERDAAQREVQLLEVEKIRLKGEIERLDYIIYHLKVQGGIP